MFIQCLQKLGWLGFCQAALPSERIEMTVVDYLGYTWKLIMDFYHDDSMSCIFIGQWEALCTACKFNAGQIIKSWVLLENLTTGLSTYVLLLCWF